MTSIGTSTGTAVTAEGIRANLLGFIERQTKAAVTTDLDLFGSGLVSSLFALQLVIQVESAFGVVVQAGDLKLDNFRTIGKITDLVLRLRGNGDA